MEVFQVSYVQLRIEVRPVRNFTRSQGHHETFGFHFAPLISALIGTSCSPSCLFAEGCHSPDRVRADTVVLVYTAAESL